MGNGTCKLTLFILLTVHLLAVNLCWSQTHHPLKEIYHNDDFQLTGITMSKSGRLFVNFPRWSDDYLNAVVEVAPTAQRGHFLTNNGTAGIAKSKRLANSLYVSKAS